jgi:hypothetical protein
MTEPKDAATVLEDAADLLLIHGRSLDAAIAADGSMCVIGAVRRASPWSWLAGSEALEAIYPRLPTGYCGIATWNRRATDDEVRDTLLLAAKDLRNEATA